MKKSASFYTHPVFRSAKVGWLLLALLGWCASPTSVQATVDNMSLNFGSGLVTFTPYADSVTYTGVFSGTGSITDANTLGLVCFAGANTYSGGTTLNGGCTLSLGNNSALGVGPLFMRDGSYLRSDLAGLTIANAIQINGSDIFDVNGYDAIFQSSVTGTGSFTVTNSSVTLGSLTLAGSTGGDGGPVSLAVDGSVTATSSRFNVSGGDGWGRYGGTGGAASASIGGGLMVTDGSFSVTGGDAAVPYNGSGAWSGNAGSASLTVGGAASLVSSAVSVVGGTASDNISGGATQGNGGNATGLWGSGLSLTSSSLNVVGGNGGSDSLSGLGGNGGNAVLGVLGDLAITDSSVNVLAGAAGTGGGRNGTKGSSELAVSGAVSMDGSTLDVEGDTASVTVGSLAMTGGSEMDVYGDTTASFAATGAVSMDNSTLDVEGDTASVTVGSLAMTGGSETDVYGGTTASFAAANAVSMDQSGLYVEGGNASASMGSLAMTDDSYLGVTAYDGTDNSEGDAVSGGSAALTVAGAVSMDSGNIEIAAGNGGSSTSYAAGDGGNATASMGSLALSGNPETESFPGIALQGGNGGSATTLAGSFTEGTPVLYGDAGNGGSAALTVAGAVSVANGSLDLSGGNGGSSDEGNGGQGGDSALGVVGDMTLDGSNVNLAGGTGGNAAFGYDEYNEETNDSQVVGGVGGDGGQAAWTVAGAVTMVSSTASLTGGNGGTAVADDAGNGGDASVSVGTGLSLTDSTLALRGGNGGNASSTIDDNGDWVGGNGGDAGNATVSVAGTLSMENSLLRLDAGTEGWSDEGSEGALGTAAVSVGALAMTDGSEMDLYGSTAALGVSGAASLDGSYLNVGGDSASVSAGSLALVNDSVVDVYGSTASLGVSGAASLDGSRLSVEGESASVSMGSLVMTDDSEMSLYGSTVALGVSGAASLDGSSLNVGGDSASVSVGSLSLSGASSMRVGAFNSLPMNAKAIAPQSPAPVSGGTASLQVAGDLMMSSGSGLSVEGGTNVYLEPSAKGMKPLESTTDPDATLAVGGSLGLSGASTLGVSGSIASVSVSGDMGVSDGSSVSVEGDVSSSLTVAGALGVDGSLVAVGGEAASLSAGSLAVVNDGALRVEGFITSLNTSGAVSLDSGSLRVNGFRSAVSVGSMAVNGSSVEVRGMSSASLASSGPVSVNAGSVSVGGNVADAVIESLNLADATASLDVEGEDSAAVSLGGLFGEGSLTVNADSATLQVGRGDFAGAIHGSIGLEKVGGAEDVLVLRGASDYTGPTTVTGGTLAVDTNGVLGTSPWVQVGGEGTLAFINAKDASGLSIVNNGRTFFENTSSAGTANVDNGGALVFEGASTAGSATVAGQAGSWTLFREDALGGNASFTLASGESVTEIGGVPVTQTVQSHFDISGSSSGVTVGSLTGSGMVLLGSKNLGLGANDGVDMFLTGPIVDGGLSGGVGGSLTKLGTGTLVLAGDDSYSGGTFLEEGSLEIGNSRALGTGDLTLNGGTLSTTLGNHLIVVGGDYTQSASATLSLGLSGTGLGEYDRVGVVGRADLGGTLALSGFTAVPEAVGASHGASYEPTIGDAFDVLTASGGVSGRFVSITDPWTDIRLYDVYFANDVVLEAMPTSFTDLSKTYNQTQVAGMLDAIYPDRSQAATMLLAGLGTLRASEYAGAYDRISPSSLTSLAEAGFRVAGLQASALSGRLDGLLSSRSAFNGRFASIEDVRFAGNLPAEVEMEMARHSSRENGSRWGGFLDGEHATLTLKGDGNGEGTKATIDGLTAAGVDYQLSRVFALGLLVGCQGTDLKTDGGSRYTVQGGQAGLYALARSGGLYGQALVEGGRNSYDLKRASFGGTAVGRTDGTLASGQLGLGYRWTPGVWTLGPVADAQYTRVGVKGYSETGSLSPETFGDQSSYSLMLDAGARVAARWDVSRSFSLTPSVKGLWLHETHDQGGVETASIAGQSFTVQGPALGQNGFRVEAGLTAQFRSGFNLTAEYQKDLGRDGLEAQTFGGRLQFKL